MRSYFITNIIIFVFSSFLTSFAFDSYDRSFEVILITILLTSEKNDDKNLGNVMRSIMNMADSSIEIK